MQGFDISIVTTAKNDEESYSLLKKLGMPLRPKV
jgi:ribosomal protein L5